MMKDALLAARAQAAKADTLKNMREYALTDQGLTCLLMEVGPNDPIFPAGASGSVQPWCFCGLPVVIDRTLPDDVIELRGGAKGQTIRVVLNPSA